jgi:hypothetical protein
MKTKLVLFAFFAGASLGLAQTSHAQNPGHRPPPPPPQTSGSNGVITSGSNTGEPGHRPPPILSGTDNGTVTSGTGNTLPPPCTSGTNNPSTSGSNNAPPAQQGSVFEALNLKVEFEAVSETSSSDASAIACLQVVNHDGTLDGSLNVNTKGLAAATYTVSATLSDETDLTLGTFTVADASTLGGTKSAKNAVVKKSGHVAFGDNGIIFPDGLDPFDIASLSISDADGNVIFTADLTTITDGAFNAHVPIVVGALAPGAVGFADIKVMDRDGSINGILAIKASGVPASTTYTYSINGADIDTVTSTTDGHLKITASTSSIVTGVDLFNNTSITVHDASSNVILSASF